VQGLASELFGKAFIEDHIASKAFVLNPFFDETAPASAMYWLLTLKIWSPSRPHLELQAAL
jgi:hypothetical protein